MKQDAILVVSVSMGRESRTLPRDYIALELERLSYVCGSQGLCPTRRIGVSHICRERIISANLGSVAELFKCLISVQKANNPKGIKIMHM